MKFLLDEMFPGDMVGFFVALGHEGVAVRDSSWRGFSDEALMEVARDFDILVTLDLHRQGTVWIAIHRAIWAHNLKVLRIRLPDTKSEQDLRRAIISSIMRRFDEWLYAIETGACIVTLTHGGASFRNQSPVDVQDMLERLGSDQLDPQE